MSRLRQLFFLFSWVVLFSLQAQSYSKIEAEENFRLGVNSFHFGLYQQSLLLFEKSLAFLAERDDSPLRNRLYFWLGRSYYQNGNTAQALKSWSALIDRGAASSALKAFAEIVNGRYSLPPDDSPVQLARFGYLEPGKKELFRRPSAMVQSPIDSLRYLVDFADNSILLLDINGKLIRKLKGSLYPTYHRPYDILFPREGGFIVSDFAANRLIFHDLKGHVSMSRGEESGLLGPQYLAATGDGYFYVSEWGHQRVVKWDLQGNEVFSFGNVPQPGFSGLVSPTGIVANDKGVFVADASERSIYLFDHDGNYTDTILKKNLDEPEGLLLGTDNQLLIADKSKIRSYNFSSKSVRTLYQGDPKSKYYRLSYDRNGNLMASDFNNRRVELLMNEAELYSNLFVSINRISSDEFPEVKLEVEVESHNGQAVLDLVKENFSLFEENQVVQPLFLGSADDGLTIGFVAGGAQFLNVLQSIEKELTERDSLQVVLDRKPLHTVSARQLRSVVVEDTGQHAELSQALRMGNDALLTHPGRRILIYLDRGDEMAEFTHYGLAEILQLFNNNNIRLLVIGLKKPDGALRYLLEHSEGFFIDFEQLPAISDYISRQRNRASNVYYLAYQSHNIQTLQNQYIKNSVIVHYGQRSGRDESGYFPPL